MKNIFRKNLGALSFVEVMLTVAILSFGLVMIIKAFLITVQVQNHVLNRSVALNLAEHRLAYIQRLFEEKGILPSEENGKVYPITINGHQVDFYVAATFEGVGNLKDVFHVKLNVTWKERQRSIKLSRQTFISII